MNLAMLLDMAVSGLAWCCSMGWSWQLTPPSPALVTSTVAPQVAQV